MDKVFQGLAKPAPSTAPRFSVFRAAGGSLVACLWLCTPATDALAAIAPGSAYRSVLENFDHASTGPSTLARSRRSRATPSPSPDATATPAASPGVTANQGGGAATSAATPSDEFTGKYEAAYAKFLEKNYPETLSLLDEADKVQPGQSQAVSLRFKAHYALAYLEYRKQNYPGALAHLDDADRTQKNADSFNLRGLIFSKQHNYDQAEVMFHKAVVTDPALWAAKFNYAELPFNRGNYTDARTRFEELFGQTDAAKQPREAELTQYKVFLTLLLEGKVEAASTFMDHLNFSGATPARYFCNAALNFRAGSVDKAKNWIDDAKKEYPPQLVAIFIESFYRLGWMADPNAPPGTMLAQATPAGTPAVTTSGTQPTTVATATAPPLPSPTPAVAAASTPIIVAAASPTPTPLAAAATPKPTPAPTVALVTPTATPRPTAVAVATPAATPTVVPATATPRPTAVAVTTPTATPTAAPATATPRPTAVAIITPPVATPARTVPAATASPTVAVAVSTPAVTPAHTAAPTPVSTPATARATPTPTVPVIAQAKAEATSAKRKNTRRILLLLVVLGQTLYYLNKMRLVLEQRKQSAFRAAERRRRLAESSK